VSFRPAGAAGHQEGGQQGERGEAGAPPERGAERGGHPGRARRGVISDAEIDRVVTGGVAAFVRAYRPS